MVRGIVIAALSLTGFLAGVHHWALDGVGGLIFGGMLSEDTVYAAGYSDSGFRHVTLGMSRSDVEALIGAPQKEWAFDQKTDHPGVGARWSYSPGDTNFRCRVILFRNGVVVEKHTEFYVD